MTRAFIIGCLAVVIASSALAESVVPTRAIRSNSIITADDITLVRDVTPGALSTLEQAIGQEARVTLYPGRAIQRADIGPAAVVTRNQVVSMVYYQGALKIVAEGRALGRAGIGERVRVMNIDSRSIVNGIVRDSNSVEVGR